MFVVAGATGRTGSVVAETLLQEGVPVRVLLRNASQAERWKARGAEVVVTALEDVPALAAALEGARGLYVLLPPDPRASDPRGSCRAMAEAVATAMEQQGVPRGVLLSSMGAHQPEGTGIIRTLHHAEQRLARTPARWTFLRAAYFMENFGAILGPAREGTMPTFIRPDLALPTVATRDVGRVAARALAGGAAEGPEVIELAGPREVTAEEVAGVLARLLSRQVGVRFLPEEAIVPAFVAMGASEALAEEYRAMHRGVNDGTVAWQGGRARSMRGETELADVLGGLLAAPGG